MLRRITIDQLRVGMYVEQVDKDWFDIPFFRRHISSPEQIEKLRSYYVRELVIDTGRGADVEGAQQETAVLLEEPPSQPAPEPPRKIRSAVSNDFREELGPAKVAYAKAIDIVHNVLDDSRSGRYLQEQPVREVVSDLVDSCMRNDDALVSLTKLLAADEYTFSHSVNVTIFSLMLAKSLRFSREEMQMLGESVLLHDVGKMLVPPEILTKPGKLTAEEFEIMKEHVPRGVNFLRESFPHRPELPIVAQDHHERIDGSGYPQGKRGDEIHRWGQIAAIADVYDALTSQRCYKKEIQPHRAVALIYRLSGADFNSHFVERFIECVGIYPIGSLVRLSTGEVALVVSIRHEDLLRPEVLVLYRQGHRLRNPRLVDLTETDRQGKPVREITDILNPDDYGVNPAAHILEAAP